MRQPMLLRITEAIDTPDGVAYAGAVTEMTRDEFDELNPDVADELVGLDVGESVSFIGGLVERVG